ncbi:hypothetical protein KUCAC02_020471 [Chaenocephalus aceratus]|nr:hypothetical protein KUCAC02_020471 [Chaenocephalus aceratus]
MSGPRPVVPERPLRSGEEHSDEEADEGARGHLRLQRVTHNKKPTTRRGKRQDYHYTTREVMQDGIDNGDFIENAEFSGNLYGTSKAAIQDVIDKNLMCILDVDIQGVRRIKETELNPIYISIQPPSMDVLTTTISVGCDIKSPQTYLGVNNNKHFMRSVADRRQRETEESLQKRLEAARIDMELSNEPGVFDVVIINDDLERAYEELRDLLSDEIQKVKEVKS